MIWLRKISRFPRLGKWLFFSIIFLAALTFVMYMDIIDSLWLDVNFSEPYIDESLTLEILKDDVAACITRSLPAAVPDGSDIELDINFDHTALTVLSSFNNLLSYLGVKAVIIEPSVLYCMLRPKYQKLLLKRNFEISNFSKPNNILTYGIMEHDVATLQKEGTIHKFRGIDFQPYFLQRSRADWMLKARPNQLELDVYPSHIFFKHKLYIIHVVVFYARNSYFWHSALGAESNQRIPLREILKFVNHDSAYEKFAFVSLENRVSPIADFYVPSNPHHFLFQMKTSRFLECNFTRTAKLFFKRLPESHPEMSVGRFNRRFRIALRELKSIFHPLLMDFWLWSGTVLGWYRQCDIIPYTTDVDFAAWASEVDDLDGIINSLLSSDHLDIKHRMGLVEEALEFQIWCHKMQTDVFFVYPTKNGTWYSGHSPKLGYYFRYYLPSFSVCSAELLGEKVQVPCEAEKVIEADYGRGWRTPVGSWHYETSSRNRGPNIYWDKDVLNKAYQVY